MANHNGGSAKEIMALLKRAEAAGADVTIGRGGHHKVTGKGWVVMISVSPRSVNNCVRNATKDLRRRGLDV